MATVNASRATRADLMSVEGKAELIAGKVVQFMVTGVRPSEVASNIYVSLRGYALKEAGKAFSDNIGYLVAELPSGRESFSPDASYYRGPLPQNPMDFIDGAPTLAIEVRSKNDYGRAAEDDMAAKRADYFAAGTSIVWDVDPVAEVIDSYRADAPAQPVRFRKIDIADAEPALPGWRITGQEIFA
jgi:Uma2 family endonuclease